MCAHERTCWCLFFFKIPDYVFVTCKGLKQKQKQKKMLPVPNIYKVSHHGPSLSVFTRRRFETMGIKYF